MQKVVGMGGWILAAVLGTLLTVSWLELDLVDPGARRPLKAGTESAPVPAVVDQAIALVNDLRSRAKTRREVGTTDESENATNDRMLQFLEILEVELTGGTAQSLELAMTSTANMSVPVDFHADLLRLRQLGETAVGELREQEFEQWAQTIEELFADTEEAATQDTIDQDELSALLLRAAILAARKQSIRSSTDLPSEKLQSAKVALEALLTFQNALDKGFDIEAVDAVSEKNLTLPVSGYGNPDNYSNHWIDVLYGFSNSKDSSEAAALHW